MGAEYNIHSQFTMIERAKILDPTGQNLFKIIDVMVKRGIGDVMKDVPVFPCSMGLQHRIVRTTSTPGSTRRDFYQGVPKTDIAHQVIFEPTVLFEQRSEVDEDILDTIPDVSVRKQTRQTRDEAHIKGLINDWVYAIFNDDRTSGSKYMSGFKARTSKLSSPGSALPYCYNNGGSTALMSIYIIEWGPDACHGIYPPGEYTEGGQLGVKAIDKGKEKVFDSTPNPYYAYVSQFKRWGGLAINDDWKFCRIANIESAKTAVYGINEDILIEALNHGKFNMAASRIYTNPYGMTQIDIRAKDRLSAWQIKDVFGEPVMTFRGVPIRVIDETILGIAESAVST